MRKIIFLVIAAFVVLGGCASTASVKEEAAPSEGNAIVYLAYLWVTQVDGRRVSWNPMKQYEIAAGSHQLEWNMYVGENRIAYSTSRGFFEEGKTYYLIGIREGGGINIRTVLEIIEKVQPQSQITLPKPRPYSYSRAFITYNPDGSLLVIPNGKALEIYNVRDGTLVKTLAGHSKDVTAGTWSRDGAKIISGDEGGTVKIWDAAAGSEIRSIGGQKGNVSALEATPDGTKFVGSSGNILKVWDIASGTELVSINDFALNNAESISIPISPNGRYFAALFKDSMRVYPINGGKPVFAIERGKIPYIDVFAPLAFQDDNTLLAYRSGREVSGLAAVDISSGEVTMKNPARFYRAVYSTGGERIITLGGGSICFIRIVDAETGGPVTKLTPPLSNYTSYIKAFDVSPAENTIATLSNDGIRLWNFESVGKPDAASNAADTEYVNAQ